MERMEWCQKPALQQKTNSDESVQVTLQAYAQIHQPPNQHL